MGLVQLLIMRSCRMLNTPITRRLPHQPLTHCFMTNVSLRHVGTGAPPQLWPSMQCWPPIAITGATRVVNKIDNAVNGHQVLNMLSIRDYRDEFKKNPELLTCFCRRLLFIHYIECEEMPRYRDWLKTDIQLAYKQLSRSMLKSMVAPVSRHRQFDKLLHLVDDSIESVTIESLNEIMLDLLYLGVDKHSMLLRKMYVKAKRNAPDATWNGIANLLRVASAMGESDYRLYSTILKRLKSDQLDKQVTPDQSLAFVTALNACPSLFTPTLCELLSQELIRIFADDDFMNDAHNITTWTTAAAKIYIDANVQTKVNLERSFLQLRNVFARQKNKCSILQIGQIMGCLHALYPPSAIRLLSFKEYLGRISYQKLKVKDLFILAAYSDYNTERQFKGYIRDRLQGELSPQYGTAVNADLVDYELVFRIAAEGHLHGALRGSLKSLVRLGVPAVLDMPWHAVVLHPEWDAQGTEALLAVINKHLNSLGYIPNKHLCLLAALVFANGRTSETYDVVLEKVQRILHNCSVTSLAVLLKGVSAHWQMYGKRLQHREAKMFTLLFNCIGNSLHNRTYSTSDLTFPDFRHIFYLTMIADVPFRNAALGITVMEQIEQLFQKPVTLHIEDVMLKQILLSDYYSPVIMGFVARAVIDTTTHDEYQTQRILSVSKVLARFGYQPQCMPELLAIFLNMFAKAKSVERWDVCVQLLNNLSALDIYPENELLCLFSTDVMNDILRFVREKVVKKGDFLRHLCNLNKSVVILRPTLDVEWMGDQLTGRFTDKDRSPNTQETTQLIDRALVEMCGGEKFINRTVVKFDTTIGFEIALDKDMNPLPIGESTERLPDEVRRIAILPANKCAVACNDHDVLLNDTFMRKRILEGLGYDVLFVVRNQWRFNGARRLKDLHNAIFKREQRTRTAIIR